MSNNQPVVYNRADGGVIVNRMNDGLPEKSEREYDYSDLKNSIADSLLQRPDSLNSLFNNGDSQSPRMNRDNEPKQWKRYANQFRDYIGDQLNLDYKQELMDSLDKQQPYQRCFLFFNDNRKYRQLHELYKSMRIVMRNVSSKKRIDRLAKCVQYSTSTKFLDNVKRWRSVLENGLVIGNNQQPRVMSLDYMYGRCLENAKEIANSIVSSCCLDCTAEPQVIE